ncbi:thyrotropin-releasing hormone receptor-like [Elysia marginata]|uniref:Thyrotropin-releasing hormone receptor n=1 Tax=Elysia marginata TaxID=1093978 RepID=A0AAV4K1F0_9GAST|nr:thyrotropin-releasing hormone receptor-like [Elysia marginata]
MDSGRNLNLTLRDVLPTSTDLTSTLPCVSRLDYMTGNFSNSSTSSFPPCAPLDNESGGISERYSVLFGAVAVTLSAVIFVFGTVGNTLVVLVITRTRSMHTPTNCYLLSLAVADSLVLLSATLPAIPEPFFRVEEWPYGRALCSVLIFLQYLGVDCSAMSIAAFTVERYIAICHPMRAQTMCTVSRAKHIIGGLWIFTFLYCAPWLGLTEIVEQPMQDGPPLRRCHFRFARSSYLVLYMVDLILFYAIPLVVATVLYLLIGRILHESRNIRRNDSHLVARGSLQEAPLRRGDSRIQVIRMLVVVVLAFATLWMPYRVMVVYNSFAQHKYMDVWFLLFARTMIYINCAINPVLYNIMSLKFKRAFRNYLSCCPMYRRKSIQSTHYSEIPTDALATRRINSSGHVHQQQYMQQQHHHCPQFRSRKLSSNSSQKQLKQQNHQHKKCPQIQHPAQSKRDSLNTSLKQLKEEQKQLPPQEEQRLQQPGRQWQQFMSSVPVFQDRRGDGLYSNSSNTNTCGSDKNGLNKIPMCVQNSSIREGPSKSFYSIANPISSLTGSKGALYRDQKPHAAGSEKELSSTITMKGTIVGVNMAENAV